MLMKKTLYITLTLLLSACANNDNTQQEQPVKLIKPVCSIPPAPRNIWKLELMLKVKGLITDNMTKEKKETVIRNYINKKNSTYTHCLKGK